MKDSTSTGSNPDMEDTFGTREITTWDSSEMGLWKAKGCMCLPVERGELVNLLEGFMLDILIDQ